MNEETILSAQINFESLEKMIPQIKNHPIYLIAKSQLDEFIEEMKEEETKEEFK